MGMIAALSSLKDIHTAFSVQLKSLKITQKVCWPGGQREVSHGKQISLGGHLAGKTNKEKISGQEFFSTNCMQHNGVT